MPRKKKSDDDDLLAEEEEAEDESEGSEYNASGSDNGGGSAESGDNNSAAENDDDDEEDEDEDGDDDDDEEEEEEDDGKPEEKKKSRRRRVAKDLLADVDTSGMTPAELIAFERATLLKDPTDKTKLKKRKKGGAGGKRKKKSRLGSSKDKKKRKVKGKETDATKAASAAAVEEDEDAEDQEAKVTTDERKNGLILAAHKSNKFTANGNVRLLPQLTRVLKPHQVIGVRFLWKQITASNGGQGCILADHMGLGKTLQVISLIHLFLSADETLFGGEPTATPPTTYGLGGQVDVVGPSATDSGGAGVGTTASVAAAAGPSSNGTAKGKNGAKEKPYKRTVLVLAPSSVVRNWRAEMEKWFGKASKNNAPMNLLKPQVLNAQTAGNLSARVKLLKKWHAQGGVLIMGYEMFRQLAIPTSGKSPALELEASELVTTKPGPSMVVVDEGHRLRQPKSKVVKSVSMIKTNRRMVLTGYPLQNHLMEYWCMVNFASAGFLGPAETFKLRFENPIVNGQAMDSTPSDVALARTRTFVLTELLKPVVLRRDSSHLAKTLPSKCEWVLHCKMSNIQAQLYRAFVRDRVKAFGNKNGNILEAYHRSLSIVNHPDIIYLNMKCLDGDNRKHLKRLSKIQPMTPHKIVDGDMGEVEDDLDDSRLATSRTNSPSNSAGSGAKAAAASSPDAKRTRRTRAARATTVNTDARSIYADLSSSDEEEEDEEEDEEDADTDSGKQESVTEDNKATKGDKSNKPKRRKRKDSDDNDDEYTEGDYSASGSPSRKGGSQSDSDDDDDDEEEDGSDSDGGVEFVESVAQGENGAVPGFEWAAPLLRSYPDKPRLDFSGKMVVLFSILNGARLAGDKVLVFSQSVVTLKIIRAVLDQHNKQVRADAAAALVVAAAEEVTGGRATRASTRRGGGVKEEATDASACEPVSELGYLKDATCGYLELFGSTPQAKRHPLVKRFNHTDVSELAVFLLSTRAAGEGLNLQSANRVVMFDMCWNPCLDHEAMCRSYRFGQKKPVSVYRLVGAGTMEEKIYDQQIRKETLTHKVVDARALGNTCNTTDLKDFFNLQRFNSLQRATANTEHRKTLGLADDADVRGINLGAASILKPSVDDDNGDDDVVAMDEGGGEADDDMGVPVKEEDEELQAQKVETLKKDSVLLKVLKDVGALVNKYSLEDLLTNEDPTAVISPEERKQAMLAFEKQRELEREFMKKGYAAGAASAMAMSEVGKQFPGLGFGDEMRPPSVYQYGGGNTTYGYRQGYQQQQFGHQPQHHQPQAASGSLGGPAVVTDSFRLDVEFHLECLKDTLGGREATPEERQEWLQRVMQSGRLALNSTTTQEQHDARMHQYREMFARHMSNQQAHDQQMIQQQQQQVISLPQTPPRPVGLFGGLSILILSRRMGPGVGKRMRTLIKNNGGSVAMQCDKNTTHVISTWPQDKLNKWLQTAQARFAHDMNVTVEMARNLLRPEFKNPEWVDACVGERVVEGRGHDGDDVVEVVDRSSSAAASAPNVGGDVVQIMSPGGVHQQQQHQLQQQQLFPPGHPHYDQQQREIQRHQLQQQQQQHMYQQQHQMYQLQQQQQEQQQHIQHMQQTQAMNGDLAGSGSSIGDTNGGGLPVVAIDGEGEGAAALLGTAATVDSAEAAE